MWPRTRTYGERYRVTDLVPSKKIKVIFIAESPHKDEVSSENPEERSPFRGIAGREWWGALSKFTRVKPPTREIPPRDQLLVICNELGIAVMNAVQFPLDPKITLHEGAECSPHQFLGFQKSSGPLGYKAVIKTGGQHNPVESAISDLRGRLIDLKRELKKSNQVLIVVCLGNDSRWFVERATAADFEGLEIQTIPHPSSWWRKAEYRSRALKLLEELLG